jgi:DNA-binding transcriptional LysR family regulator
MARNITLRQIEAFKAVMENGTISRAAELLNISQPAASRLIAYLEIDAGFRLFDRAKGRIAPTRQALRLYDELTRIFSGVRQVENAIDAIRRNEQGRLAIGVMPGLAGSFMQRALSGFLLEHPSVFCSVEAAGSQRILDWLIARRLDVGLVDAGIDNPYVVSEPLMRQPLICILPLGHPLASKTMIRPEDLRNVAFVRPHTDTYVGQVIDRMLDDAGIEVRTVLVANVAPTLCESVAAGLGVSLVPLLFVSGLEQRLIVRPFEPEILYNIQLCRSADSRNEDLVEVFAENLKQTAAQIFATMNA